MTLSNYFSIPRFWLLLKMELYRSRKGILMTLVISFGLMFFMGLILGPVFEPGMLVFEHYQGFAFVLLAGGFILSSMAFRDLGNDLRRYNYLTLPASGFEKFLSMWLLTSVGWIILFTVLYTVYTLFANAIGQIIYRQITFLTFNPFADFSLGSIKYYFVLQGIFMVGASHFKGFVFPKTLFALIIFAAVCGLLGYLMMADLFAYDSTDCMSDEGFFEGLRVYKFSFVLKWLFWWIVAPLCWVVTYLGLKEKEV